MVVGYWKNPDGFLQTKSLEALSYYKVWLYFIIQEQITPPLKKSCTPEGIEIKGETYVADTAINTVSNQSKMQEVEMLKVMQSFDNKAEILK